MAHPPKPKDSCAPSANLTPIPSRPSPALSPELPATGTPSTSRRVFCLTPYLPEDMRTPDGTLHSQRWLNRPALSASRSSSSSKARATRSGSTASPAEKPSS
jgi:hypothetical protein